MAEYNRPRLASLRSVEAGLHMHRRAEAVRTAVRNGRDSDAAPKRIDMARQDARQKSYRDPNIEPAHYDSTRQAWWQRLMRPSRWWRAMRRVGAPFAGIV